MQPGGRKGFGRTVYLKIINTYGENSAGLLFPVRGGLRSKSALKIYLLIVKKISKVLFQIDEKLNKTKLTFFRCFEFLIVSKGNFDDNRTSRFCSTKAMESFDTELLTKTRTIYKTIASGREH